MTNEEAIRRIKEHVQIHQRKEPRAVNITIALAKAINALEEQRVGHWIDKKPNLQSPLPRLNRWNP